MLRKASLFCPPDRRAQPDAKALGKIWQLFVFFLRLLLCLLLLRLSLVTLGAASKMNHSTGGLVGPKCGGCFGYIVAVFIDMGGLGRGVFVLLSKITHTHTLCVWISMSVLEELVFSSSVWVCLCNVTRTHLQRFYTIAAFTIAYLCYVQFSSELIRTGWWCPKLSAAILHTPKVQLLPFYKYYRIVKNLTTQPALKNVLRWRQQFFSPTAALMPD